MVFIFEQTAHVARAVERALRSLQHFDLLEIGGVQVGHQNVATGERRARTHGRIVHIDAHGRRVVGAGGDSANGQQLEAVAVIEERETGHAGVVVIEAHIVAIDQRLRVEGRSMQWVRPEPAADIFCAVTTTSPRLGSSLPAEPAGCAGSASASSDVKDSASSRICAPVKDARAD